MSDNTSDNKVLDPDEAHKTAFDHCLHCPHFNDLIDHADHSLPGLPERFIGQSANSSPVEKIPEQQQISTTGEVSNAIEAIDKPGHSMAALPKDDELLKEILGEDYATQALPSNRIYQQEGFTESSSDGLPNTADDEAEIDKIISSILDEDDENKQDESLADGLSVNLDVKPADTESTDIDIFLQKYLDDDVPSEVMADDLSEVIHDESSEIAEDYISEVKQDESHEVTSDDLPEDMDDYMAEIMHDGSSEITDDELSEVIHDESPEIMEDYISEILPDDKETNIDELIQTILEEDTTSENLSDENSLITPDPVYSDADIHTEVTELESTPRIPEEKSVQSTRAAKITDYSSALAQNTIKKTDSYKSVQPPTANYRVPGILLILIVAVGLAWYFVSGPQKESTLSSKINAEKMPKIKKRSVYHDEVTPDQEQAAPLPGPAQPFNSYSVEPERVTQSVDTSATIKVAPPLVEQESYSDQHQMVQDRLTVEEENKAYGVELETGVYATVDETIQLPQDSLYKDAEVKTHEAVVPETVISATIDEAGNDDVSAEINRPEGTTSTTEEITNETILLLQDGLHEEAESETHKIEPETDSSSTTGDTHYRVEDEMSGTTESLAELEEVAEEDTPADKVQKVAPITEKNENVFWSLNLSSVYKQKIPAARELERIRSTGIPAEIKTVFIDESKWYRIRIIGFSSYTEARDFMQEVTEKTDIQKYWISKVTVAPR